MANIYTQPVQSQFVPTYQPINLDAINIGAQGLQRRQDKAFARYDEFQEKAREMEKNLFEQDRPLFEQRTGEIRQELDELAADGDLSDAGRQIRSLASQFRDEATRGDLGEAFKNFQSVQQRYEEIDESDLDDAQKQARKNAIMAGYKGAGQGGLDLSINTDDIDYNEWIEDTLGNVNNEKLTQGTDWTWNSTIGKFEKGEITTEGIPTELIQSTVANALANDPGAMSAMRQRARVATAGEDEFVVEEDGQEKIISREEMMKRNINRQMNQMVQLGQQKYGKRVTGMDTSVTAGGEGFTGPGGSGVSMVGLKKGQTFAKNVNITSFQDALQTINGAEATDRQSDANDLRGSFNRALNGFMEHENSLVEEGEPPAITQEDIEFMKDIGSRLETTDDDYRPISGGAGAKFSDPLGDAGIKFESKTDKVGREDVNRYNRLRNKFDTWIEEGGGWTDQEYFLKDEDRVQDITQFVSRVSNPNDWKIYGQGDADSTEYLSQDSGSGASVLSTFKFQSVVASNEYAPTMISGTVTVDGEEVPVRLTEKSDPNKPSSVSDMTDSILERYGTIGENIKQQRKYEDIQPSLEFENVYNKLPSELRAVANNKVVNLNSSGGMFQVEYGNGEDVQPFTVGDAIKNIYKYPPKSMDPRDFIETHNPGGTLTEEEIGIILDGRMTPDIERKLKENFTEPHEFTNKISALEVGAKYTG